MPAAEADSLALNGRLFPMRHLKMGLAAAALCLGFGLGGAEASVNRPLPHPQAGGAVVPAALCVRPGRGVFRVPGPPWECRRFGGFPARGGPGPYYRGGPRYGAGPYFRGRPDYRGPYRGDYRGEPRRFRPYGY